MELGCLHFGSESSSWFGASSYCEEIHPNSTMLEILSQEENDLVSLVGNVMITMTDVERWWIGLEDIGHEGIWEWQPSSSVASYFSWGYDKPSSDPVNRNDCVYMSPNPLDNDFVWTDFYCESQDKSIKIAPLCQLWKETTATPTSTIEVQTSSPTTEVSSSTASSSSTTEQTTSSSPKPSTSTAADTATTSQRQCPESYDEYEWVPFGGHCYKFVKHTLDYDAAQSYCRENENNNGDLLSIHSMEENEFIWKLGKDKMNKAVFIWDLLLVL